MRPFAYQRVDDAAAAVRAASTGSQFLAGGTTLLDLMKLDVVRPDRLIDINGLSASHGRIEVQPQGVRLGALVAMSAAADHPAIVQDYPVIAQSLALAASAQLR